MDILVVDLNQIVWDLENRVHLDIENMKRSIQQVGLLTPLYVVGPDKYNKYCLIDGSRRFAALKALALHDSKFNRVKVIRYRSNVGTRLYRETLRFHINNTSKKITGAEVLTTIENIQEQGQYSDEEVIEVVQPKQSQIKRMKNKQTIDKRLRDEVSQRRASQHALEIIYSMQIPTKLFSNLYKKLLNRKLTGTDADALKKLDKHPLFGELTDNQKLNAINRALAQANFTNKEAELIILSEIMKDSSNGYDDFRNEWINYLAQSLNEITNMLPPNIEALTNPNQKELFRVTLSKLNSLLYWTWDREFNDEKNRSRTNNAISDFIGEETETGYKFRIH